jgi:hypothetical protein
MFKIDYNFWDDVEVRDNLKFVIYGDSIAEDELVLVSLKDNNYKPRWIKFIEIWNILESKINITYINDKEYLYINDEIEICTYFENEDIFKFKVPKYLMRHKINDEICKLKLLNGNILKLTYDHSLLNYDNKTNRLFKISPLDANNIIVANPYYLELVGTNEIKSKNNISTINIISKEEVKYNSYVYDFSVSETQNFVVNGYLVHNTDSLYVNIPTLDNNIPAQEAWDKISNISSNINHIIKDALDESILPKLGVDKKYNRTDFKTESLIISMMLMGVKKNYAYKKIAEEGHIYETPKITYKGIPIVRSDFSKFTQQFIKYIVDNIALNTKNLTRQPIDILQEFAKEKKEELYRELDNYNYRYVATPGRWGETSNYKKETYTIIGMRTYNTIFNKEIFRPGLSGYSLPINIINRNDFLNKISNHKSDSILYLNNTNIDNITFITVPYNYEPEDLKNKFKEYFIEINYEETWDKNVNKIVKHIIDVVKMA